MIRTNTDAYKEAAKNLEFYKTHMNQIYRFNKQFDMYSCSVGRITVNPGALCKIEYHYYSDSLDFKFLRSKNSLPNVANDTLREDFDNITEQLYLPSLGDIVFHTTKDYGVGCVKENNGIDRVLVEFGTIDKPGYIRDWFFIEDLNCELDKTEEIELNN